MISFVVEATDRGSAARAGQMGTPHGEVPTPVFMPVGTHAAVRALTPEQLRQTGARIVLANTYHLALRPGPELVQKAGPFAPTNWNERASVEVTARKPGQPCGCSGC